MTLLENVMLLLRRRSAAFTVMLTWPQKWVLLQPSPENSTTHIKAGLLCMFLLVVNCHVARGQTTAAVGNVLSSPMYVNLYWDSDWDADHPGMHVAALDSFTNAVLNSSYFNGLAEYGVGSPTFGGGYLPDRSCPQKPPPRVLFYNPFYASIIGFLNCELQSGNVPVGSQVIYNIILPNGTLEPDLPPPAVAWHFHQTPYSPAAVLAIGAALLAADTGADAATFIAFLAGLGALQGGPIYTIETADHRGGILANNLLHEMIEAASNPFPTVDSILENNEIVDVAGKIVPPCLDQNPFVPFVPPEFAIPTLNFTTPSVISVPQYWSNSGQACTTGFTSKVTPTGRGLGSPMVLTTVSGANLAFMITGGGFGTLPVYPDTMGNLPYIAVQDDTQKWQAGNSLNNDAIGLNIASWSDDQISVSGFQFNREIGIVEKSDSFSFWVCNPASGKCTWGTFPPVVSSVYPNTTEYGSSTSVAITGANFYHVYSVSLDQGRYSLSYTVDALSQITATIPNTIPSGSHSITVDTSAGSSAPSAEFFVRPVITAISPKRGPKTGGTEVQISGNGFPSSWYAAMPVSMGNIEATARCGYGSCFLGTPAYPNTGAVDIIGTVSGASSLPSAADQFTYTEYPELTAFILPDPSWPDQSAGVVALNGVAPAGGALIALSSSRPEIVAIPRNVTIPECTECSAEAASVPLTFLPTANAETITLTAQYQNSSASATLSAAAWPPIAVGIQAVDSAHANVTVTMNTVAPAGGAAISLATSDSSAISLPVPPSVMIPAGSYQITFQVIGHFSVTVVNGKPVIRARQVKISASSNGATASLSTTVPFRPVIGPAKCPKGSYWNQQDSQCDPGTPM